MIIFTDVDGTLYDFDLKLPASAKTAIRKLKENGHQVYMVTGRSKAENSQELWDLDFDGIICGNGSYIESHGKVVYHEHLSYDQCRRIVDWCERKGLGFYEESNNGLFASETFYKKDGVEAIVRYKKEKGATPEELENIDLEDVIHGLKRGEELYRDDVNKISFVLHSYDDYLEAKKEFADLTVSTWGGKGEAPIFGDAGIPDADKAKAIGMLLEYLGEDVKNTIAIGDAKVDIPMLEYCNIGIAMGSGGDEIKAMADYVTDDVDRDGFYKAFGHFGLI